MPDAAKLFGDAGGIVVGERYRVDKDSAAGQPFRAADLASWGNGGRSPLLCFDGSFGSSHGIVFASSGGYKTVSMAAPPLPAEVPFSKGAVPVMLAVSFAFPLAGLTLLAVLAADFLVLSRVPFLKRVLS